MMKTTTKLGSLLLASTLLFSSCQRSGGCGCEVDDPYAKGKGDLRVSSNIVQPGTRVAGETWEVSDAIGIFALNEGQALGANNYATNAKYTTASAGGKVAFTSAMEGINLPSTGNLDLVAYYPYKEGVTTELAFDTSDQSKPALIDLLYSNNQKGINKQNGNANLVFSHMLTLIEFNITTDGLAISNGTIALKDVLVDGKMALANGAITTGTKTATPSVAIKAAGTNKYKGMMILPPQTLTGKEVTFNINGKPHTANLKLAATESGYKYKVEVTYNRGQLVIVEGATINPWKEGSDNGEVIVIGGEETPTPQPEPEPEPQPQPTEGKLLFPGANFDDFDAFKASLNKFGLAKYATQVDGGKSGKALLIKGTPAKNAYIFTTTKNASDLTAATKITFYIKGTAGKSLSINVYSDDKETNNGKTYQAYKPFNLETVSGTADVTLNPQEKNGYIGTIDTQGEWVKVTLNIAGLKLATQESFFALKVGSKSDYDLMIDDFTIE
ncbi:fimbrillin family protein [uncultured Porphyromonas sp.]|uniref:fimbrillin family protein n=1 Tax=uncultured Porphyromonas sp. TaxID=159274 RepID=UPI002594BEBB|nr:fimbrillin family protein [uncultured Porphyromonas sp.]